MDSVWFKPKLSDVVNDNDSIFDETPKIVADIISGRLQIITLLDNLTGVPKTRKENNIKKKIMFLTKLLKEIPKDCISELPLKYICIFYIRHANAVDTTIVHVLEGYSTIMDMKNYCVESAEEFINRLNCWNFKYDKYYIYLIFKKLLEKDEYIKTLDEDIVDTFIRFIANEKNPHNLLLLFGLLPKFLKNLPIIYYISNLFEEISSYFPINIDLTSNGTSVTRDELTAALNPCLCAVDDFGEYCLKLVIKKLDSGCRIAKIDSLKLLIESCKTFNADIYTPFLQTLWSLMHRELNDNTDEELVLVTKEAMSALEAKVGPSAIVNDKLCKYLSA